MPDFTPIVKILFRMSFVVIVFCLCFVIYISLKLCEAACKVNISKMENKLTIATMFAVLFSFQSVVSTLFKVNSLHYTWGQKRSPDLCRLRMFHTLANRSLCLCQRLCNSFHFIHDILSYINSIKYDITCYVFCRVPISSPCAYLFLH